MKKCEFCHLSEADRKFLLYENEFWSVYLADKQDYIGRCIVVSREHKESLSELSSSQWMALKDIVDALEALLKNELGAAMLNWSCLMNDAYKTTPPQPHVHFHVRPRYAAPIRIDDTCYHDAEFAHHYNNRCADQMHAAAKRRLFELLKHNVTAYFK